MSLRMRVAFLQVVALVASTCALVGDCEEHEPQPLLLVNGETISAAVEEVNRDWSISVSVAGDPRKIEQSEYVLWGAYSDEDRSSQTLLTDGTVLVGDIVKIEEKSVTITSGLWGELRVDRQVIRACFLLPPTDPLTRDREWQSLQAPEPTDRVLLQNRDAIAGRLLPTTERDGGGFFGLASLGIALSDAAPATVVLIEEVRAITFLSSLERESQVPSNCLLGFRDGSRVAASMLTSVASDVTQITTDAGVSLQLRSDEFRKHLTFIQPRNETVSYLSDLPAVGYKFLPLLELEWPLGIASNTLGGRLRAAGAVSFKGIGMHSTSRVAYNLDRKYRSFQAEVAIDDHAGHQGSVVFRVLTEVDSDAGESKWRLAFTSPIVRGRDRPLPIAIDVVNATRLALVIEMADRVDTRDYANWLNARLVP